MALFIVEDRETEIELKEAGTVIATERIVFRVSIWKPVLE